MLLAGELRETLREIAQDGYRPPQGEVAALVRSMLHHAGGGDGALREEIYTTVATWILEHDCLAPELLRSLLPRVLDEDHIFFRIGEAGGDGVFTRSFSMLWLPLLLSRHRARPYLGPAQVAQVKAALLRYLREEQDRRGWVGGKGWAHAVAHAADVLDDLARCREMGEADLRDILGAVRDVVCVSDSVYGYGEEERLATAVLAVLARELLAPAELEAWLRSFATPVHDTPTLPQRLALRSNVKNFLQSLYFRLRWEGRAAGLLRPVEETLRAIG
jgi:hypothetical protein